ncbi:hypothetical protein SPFM8_00082 [Salmonella phage SPFM8]|nr:hypothetical protein SPFM8_00082 [Salmonella phage SPFM8]
MDVSIALQKLFSINETEAGFVLTWRQSAGYDSIEFDWNVNLALMWICGLRPAENHGFYDALNAAFGDDEDEGEVDGEAVEAPVYVEYGEWFVIRAGAEHVQTNPNYVERPIGPWYPGLKTAAQITAKDVYERYITGK